MTAPAPHVRICDCGARICAAIERAFASGGQPAEPDAAGRRMIRGMAAEGAGQAGRVHPGAGP